MYYEDTNGFRAWYKIIDEFDNGGNKDIAKLKHELVLNQCYHRTYPGGLVNFVATIQNA